MHTLWDFLPVIGRVSLATARPPGPSEVSDYQAGPNHGQNEWWCLMKGGGLHNAEEAYFPLTKLPWVQFSRVLLLMLLIFIDGTP